MRKLQGLAALFTVIIVINGAFSEQATAQSQPKRAIVITENAFVFDAPSFDAAVLTYLSAGKKILVFREISAGYGKFYQFRFNKSFAYIATIDVKLVGEKETLKATKNSDASADTWESEPGAETEKKPDPMRTKPSSPIFFSSLAGGYFGLIDIKEDIKGLTKSSMIPVLGLKLTGDNWLIRGPILELTLGWAFQAPDYYEDFTDKGATGYAIIANLDILIPFREGREWLIFWGLGPAFQYSSYSATLGGTNFEMTQARMGAHFMGGLAYRWSRWVSKVELEYTVEKTSYPGVNFVLQRNY